LIVHINYQTQYAYSEPVSFSQHLFRLFPKCDRYVSMRNLAFQTNADAAINYRRDLFDNEIASCFYPGQSAFLSASLQITLEIQPRNAFEFLLAGHAVEMPFTYSEQEARVLAPYLQGGDVVPDLPFWHPPSAPRPTIPALMELNEALHRHIAYERRDEGVAYLPDETLRLGRGACRDFSVLLAAVARGLGIAARLASGYLCEFGEGEKKAEGALHAWTELYLPGAGWVGFDPTNGYLCNHHHITAAVGLTPDDISPILGRYFHPTSVTSQMTASLQISPS
jgi:transglutaminase-like putative cysteine protease